MLKFKYKQNFSKASVPDTRTFQYFDSGGVWTLRSKALNIDHGVLAVGGFFLKTAKILDFQEFLG